MNDIQDLVAKQLYPQWMAERERLDALDSWLGADHPTPYTPRSATEEYKRLANHAPTPWLGLVVTSVAQALYVEGYRSPSAADDSAAWALWQANGLDRRQIGVHRAALGYGQSFVTVLPGRSPLTKEPTPAIRGVSPRRMMTFYEDVADDDWPMYAMRVDGIKDGQRIRVYTDTDVHYLTATSTGGDVSWGSSEPHSVGICPVVRFANMLDLEGRTPGEVGPFIPVAARIDQTTFDRLLVQRFASWVVRTVSGMSLSDTASTTGETAAEAKLRLSVEQLLVAEDPDTKFGTLAATPLDGFIAAHEADIKALAAVTQTPAHELLGSLANLSAEALAAARASLSAKVEERKHSFGESWEQTLRLAAHINGDADAARDFQSQVRWKDTEIRSLAQAADALGKLATMLGVPVELLWEKIPSWTQQDVERAKALAAQGGGLEALMRELAGGQADASAA